MQRIEFTTSASWLLDSPDNRGEDVAAADDDDDEDDDGDASQPALLAKIHLRRLLTAVKACTDTVSITDALRRSSSGFVQCFATYLSLSVCVCFCYFASFRALGGLGLSLPCFY